MMESTNETGEVMWADVACELDISANVESSEFPVSTDQSLRRGIPADV